jgi:soluble lytic murein transglycosylase-like protein
MRPNLTSIDKVLDRIEEISRKCGEQFEPRRPETPKNRFVELLDAAGETGNPKTPAFQSGAQSPPNSLNSPNSLKVSKGKTNAGDAVDDLRRQVSRFAEEYNIDEELIRAVIQVESGWKTDAVSSKGARGLMQLMPRTAAMLGVEDAFDPEQNIEGGVKYLAQLTDKYEGDVEKALAAYNAGPSRVDAAGGSPYPGTSRYVDNVMALYHRYREEDREEY